VLQGFGKNKGHKLVDLICLERCCWYASIPNCFG